MSRSACLPAKSIVVFCQRSRLRRRRCGCCRHCCSDSSGGGGGGGGCCAAQSMGVDTGGHLPCATAAATDDDAAAATSTATAAAATKNARSVSVSRVLTPAAGPSVVSVCVSTRLRGRSRPFVRSSVRCVHQPSSDRRRAFTNSFFIRSRRRRRQI